MTKGKLPRVTFYNEGHIGDVLITLPFIQLLLQKYPYFDYVHYNKGGGGTIFHGDLTCGYDRALPLVSELDGDLNIPTWMCNKEYADWEAPADYPFTDLFSVQKYYWEKIFKKLEVDIEIPSDLGIDSRYSINAKNRINDHCTNADNTITSRKKVLVYNQKSRSGQTDNQDYKSYLLRMATIFDDVDFYYTNEEDIDKKLIVNNNLYYTPSVHSNPHRNPNSKPRECDIIHNSFLSRYVDVIVGRVSGPFMYASMHNGNVKDENKIIISQHNGNDRKDDLETYFNRSICKSHNIHTKTTKETFATLEEELTQLEGKYAGFHINPALEHLPQNSENGALYIEDEEMLKDMEMQNPRKGSVEY